MAYNAPDIELWHIETKPYNNRGHFSKIGQIEAHREKSQLEKSNS